MKKLVVFQHVPHEHLGSLNPLLQNGEFQIDTVKFWREAEMPSNLESYRGLIVLGGPMGVYDAHKYPHLTIETKLIERAVNSKLPVLGICLGSQLIASALGARVYPSGLKEIGWYEFAPTENAKDDPLFRHLGQREQVFQWHGDTFDIPTGAVHLAASPLCPHQAFRYGNNVYALQFHLEVDTMMIDTWLNVPENQQEIATVKDTIDPQRILAETPAFIERLKELGYRAFGEFIRLFNG